MPTKSQSRQAAFHDAARGGDSDHVMAYLQSGGLDLEKTENGRSPLLTACTNGHTNVAKVLISAGANIHASDPEDFCCIHAAALGGFIDLMMLLLSHGANIEAVDNLQSTPLHAATLRSHPEAMRFLIMAGANISPRTNESLTPLLLVSSVGFTEAARVLLELGANPMDRVTSGDSCLLLAISNAFFSISEMLIAAGADPNHSGGKRIPVLHVAGGAGSRRIVTALLRAGADVTALDAVTFGTALSRAASFSRSVATRLLLQAGALETTRDGRGLTPMQLVGTLVPIHQAEMFRRVFDESRAVRHALLRGPAFRARSWLWPAASEAEGGATAAAATSAAVSADTGSDRDSSGGAGGGGGDYCYGGEESKRGDGSSEGGGVGGEAGNGGVDDIVAGTKQRWRGWVAIASFRCGKGEQKCPRIMSAMCRYAGKS